MALCLSILSRVSRPAVDVILSAGQGTSTRRWLVDDQAAQQKVSGMVVQTGLPQTAFAA